MSADIFEAVARREITPERGAAILQARRNARRRHALRQLLAFALLPLGFVAATVVAGWTRSWVTAIVVLLVNVAASLWLATAPREGTPTP